MHAQENSEGGDQTRRLEDKLETLGEHIEEARAASDRAQPADDLPAGVGDFNEDSSDAPGGEGVTPGTNYTTRGD